MLYIRQVIRDKPKNKNKMSTYFYLKTPITRTNLESIGVTFQDGEDDGKAKTWIVESEDKNYLHPDFTGMDNNLIYGFTRYGANNPSYLLDILDAGGIDYCDEHQPFEYEWPFSEIADVWGFDYSADEELDEAFEELTIDFPMEHYFWAVKDGEVVEFIQKWCSENQEMFEEFLKENK